MKRYHVVREVFVRDRWEERPISFERRVFRLRRDAEGQAGRLRAANNSNLWRFTVKRRPTP